MNTMQFPGMHPAETVHIFQRRHWSQLLQRLLRYIILIILPIAVITFLGVSGGLFIFDLQQPSGVLIVLGLSVYILFLWLMFFHDWLDFYLDALIVTNERIVRIEQKGLFNRMVADIRLDRIQDVTAETKGVLPTFLNYGTIHVQSAAERERFVFTDIPNPEIIKSKILEILPRSSTVPETPKQQPAAVKEPGAR